MHRLIYHKRLKVLLVSIHNETGNGQRNQTSDAHTTEKEPSTFL